MFETNIQGVDLKTPLNFNERNAIFSEHTLLQRLATVEIFTNLCKKETRQNTSD